MLFVTCGDWDLKTCLPNQLEYSLPHPRAHTHTRTHARARVHNVHLLFAAPAPRGMPQVEVEFAIDANGILSVSATDKATGTSQNIEITGSSGLSKDEIEKMKNDAEAHAGEDAEKRALVEARNQAEQLVYATRKSLEEHGDKVSAETRSGIESAISNLESSLIELAPHYIQFPKHWTLSACYK